MEFYEAIAKRRIARDFKDEDVPLETVEKIIGAGLKAPTHDHLRNWEFVILRGKEEKVRALQYVASGVGPTLEILKRTLTDGTPQQKMYAAAVSSLNPLSSIWCVVENIFLAATAEGLACSMRIPVGGEGPNAARGRSPRRLHAPLLHRPRRSRGRRAGSRAS